MQSTTNFRPVSLEKEVGHFSRNLWPRICKKVKKLPIFKKKKFFAWKNLKHLKIRSQHHLWSARQISGRYLSKKKLVIFQEICDPGYEKKSKNIQFSKKKIFAWKNLKHLKIRSQHHLCCPRQISGRYLSKKKLVIFQEICDPGYAKKEKKTGDLRKKLFCSKQPKLPLYSFATPFVQPRINFRPVSLKKEGSHFSRNLCPGYAINCKKLSMFPKIFFPLNS